MTGCPLLAELHAAPPLPPAPCRLQLERMGHLYSATTDSLAQVVAGLGSAPPLVPYERGDPAGIVEHIDGMMGVRSRLS